MVTVTVKCIKDTASGRDRKKGQRDYDYEIQGKYWCLKENF